ncbi:hypothetical protein B5P44_00525 [Mycobacterium sp. CBMA 213]|uniref:Uncharacterized protein n=1 Tax=Mycolicibacterium sp. CBMA 213 TaxID=1968788 RepID=A0A343VR88_9MYCO|nr:MULTISPECIES: hypothetical protein [unclassified Mycolicibacterium]AVN58412.1 hypothetical protein B5P44_p00117 [Mycolicibacterium sp. CBMA 213]MUL61070.1 hypothetical protein [Mycolicibacterium sp. CBMA 335]MUM03308.1 hypothetical protein [Mycolicibacterium sp. CBMA 213]
MSTYHHVVLRDEHGHYIARVWASDFGRSINRGAGGAFDTEMLPAVLAAAEEHFGRKLTAIWVDDMSCDGWDMQPEMVAPWDGPASLDDEPHLPRLVPASRDPKHPPPRDHIVLTSL